MPISVPVWASLPLAIDIGQPPAVAIAVQMGAVPVAHALADRHRRMQRPHRATLDLGQPGLLWVRAQPGAIHPGQHVIQAAANAAGGHRRQVGYRIAVFAYRHVLAVCPHMRLGDIADLALLPRADLAARHSQWGKEFLADQLVIRLAAGARGDFAGHHVQQVVVGVVRAKAVGRLEMGQAGDDVGATRSRSVPATASGHRRPGPNRCYGSAGHAPGCSASPRGRTCGTPAGTGSPDRPRPACPGRPGAPAVRWSSPCCWRRS